MNAINKKQTLLTTLLLFIFAQASVLADGYRNTPEGARAVGAFGGHRAFADDANATIHNSANLVDLNAPMIQINGTFGYGWNKFKGSGFSDKTENSTYAIPGFSAAFPINDRIAIGLAAYVPFGRSANWGSKDGFATVGYPYSGKMTVADLTPNISVRLCDSLSIGLGLDIYQGEVEQNQFMYNPIYYGPYYLGTITSHSRLTGDGSTVGWNAAATWKITDRQRLAATYRAPFSINYKGHNEYSVSGGEMFGIPDQNDRSDINAEIEYPGIAALAYGFEFTDTLRAEFNVEWMEFSVYQNLTINDSAFGSIISPQKLEDTWTFGVGGEWDFATNWTARSGFMYLENPTPDETYGTLGPDENQGVISFGLGYENDHHAIDIGYAYGLFGGRTVTGSANSPDGKYDYNLHLLSLSYGYKF
jgi:long-chain fatty acid transport protein